MYSLHLQGYVGGQDFDSALVNDTLTAHAGEPVSVLIDSLGGSLSTALSIAAAFRQHGNVSVHFVGMNASAATIASLGAAHISIDANAMYLAHKCSTEVVQWASLNADQLADIISHLEQAKTDLDKMDLNVASMYAAKCKRSTADLLDLMKVGGWLTAQEALEWGFVDEVVNTSNQQPHLTQADASALLAAGIPLPNIPITEPVAEQSQFQRFFAALAAFFKAPHNNENNFTQHSTLNTQLNMDFPTIASALSLNALAFNNGQCTLTLEQMQALEQSLIAAQTETKTLTEQVDALQHTIDEQAKHIAAQPAAPTNQVIADNNTDTDSFAAVVNRANEMLARIS